MSSFIIVVYKLGLPDCLGPHLFGFCLELDFTPQLLFSRAESKFDAMKVFTTFIFAVKNQLGAQLVFSP